MQTDIPEDDKQLDETTEQTAPVEQSEIATPEELGVGQRQSNEPFSPIDFDGIIDKAAADIATPPDDQQPASEVVADAKEEKKEEPKAEESDAKEWLKDEAKKIGRAHV